MPTVRYRPLSSTQAGQVSLSLIAFKAGLHYLCGYLSHRSTTNGRQGRAAELFYLNGVDPYAFVIKHGTQSAGANGRLTNQAIHADDRSKWSAPLP